MILGGGCHCGAIEVAYETEVVPADTDVRACQCSFCRKHNGLAVSDPNGIATVIIHDSKHLSSYEFGLKTATYVICARCGVYVAAVTKEPSNRAIVIVSALDDAARFSRPPRPVDYARETREQRVARRQLTWTPARLIVK